MVFADIVLSLIFACTIILLGIATIISCLVTSSIIYSSIYLLLIFVGLIISIFLFVGEHASVLSIIASHCKKRLCLRSNVYFWSHKRCQFPLQVFLL